MKYTIDTIEQRLEMVTKELVGSSYRVAGAEDVFKSREAAYRTLNTELEALEAEHSVLLKASFPKALEVIEDRIHNTKLRLAPLKQSYEAAMESHENAKLAFDNDTLAKAMLEKELEEIKNL